MRLIYGADPLSEGPPVPSPGNEVVGALARYRLAGKEIDLGRAQAALRESDEWWDALFNVAGMGILFGTVEGEVLAASPSLVALMGYSENELRGVEKILEITHPEDREKDLELFTELVQGKRDSYQLDKRYVRKDGSLIWGRLTIVLLRDENSEPRFVIAMVEDITAERQKAEVESRVREIEQFKKQALKLNDEVLQELVVAKLAFDNGEGEKGSEALASGLTRLKQVIDTMLAHSEALEPGDFVRGHMFMGRMDD